MDEEPFKRYLSVITYFTTGKIAKQERLWLLKAPRKPLGAEHSQHLGKMT